MTQAYTYDEYVRGRLLAWGRVFRLADRYGRLDHGTHMLQRLIEHRGEIPPPNIGFKPLTIPSDAMEIEDLVRAIHVEQAGVAAVLRATYGGCGRVGVERVRIAAGLAGRSFTRRQFYALHDIGFNRVAGALMRLKKTA